MIVVDTSAIVAIARGEPEKASLVEVLASNAVVIGTPTVLEANMVLPTYLGAFGDPFLDDLFHELSIAPVDFTSAMGREAKRAFRLFGKGQGHPAQLNFGDCMSYAVAREYGAPLLFKGTDFSLTDVRPAL